MPAARLYAGRYGFLNQTLTPVLLPAVPQAFGYEANLINFDVEQVFRLVHRLESYRMTWSVSGQVDDVQANVRTALSGAGTIVIRRYLSLIEGETPPRRGNFFFTDFGQNQFNKYARSVRDSLAAWNEANPSNLNIVGQKTNGIRIITTTLDTQDPIDDYRIDAGYTLTGASGSALGFSSAFFVKTWPRVVFPLLVSGSYLSGIKDQTNSRKRSGLFLGQPFDFYTRPEITVTLTLTALNDLPF